MSHVCGCRACWEKDALTLAEMAEHRADFERFWEDMHNPRFPKLPPDGETQRLVDVHWHEMLAIPAVRRTG